MCVFVDTGLLRLGEAEQVEETFREQFAHRPRAREGRRPLPRRARRRHRARTQAQDHRRAVHPRVRGSGARSRRRALPRAGHAVSRHRRVGRRRQRQHQVAPQRRRPPRRHGLRARRAAAPPIQGRSARGRRGARPARGDRVAPAVPGPGLGGAHHRHDHRERLEILRRPTRSSSRRSGAPASTARSGRASRCCPRCDRRRDGRRPHLRVPDHHPGGHVRRRHDRRLGPAARRRARAHGVADHQRGARREPGRLRHHQSSHRARSNGSRDATSDCTTLAADRTALVAPGQGHPRRRREQRHDQEALRLDRRASPPRTNRRDYREMLFTRRGRGRLHQRRHPLRRDHPPERRRRHAARRSARGRRASSPASRSTSARSRCAFADGETVTEGLDGLRERLAEYRALGARFAKWRATYIDHRRAAVRSTAST